MKRLIVTIVILGILGGMAGAAYAIFQPQIAKVQIALFPPENDYKGNGTGEVMFTIKSGDDGSDDREQPGRRPAWSKTYDAFYSPAVAPESGGAVPARRVQAREADERAAALAALQDPSSRVDNTAVIPEGTAEKDILQTVADATKIPLADLQAAAATPAAYGVPAEATTLEGLPVPGDVHVRAGDDGAEAIKTMVDRMFQSLDEAGVAPANRWKHGRARVDRAARSGPEGRLSQGLARLPQPARPGLEPAVGRDRRLRDRPHRPGDDDRRRARRRRRTRTTRTRTPACRSGRSRTRATWRSTRCCIPPTAPGCTSSPGT